MSGIVDRPKLENMMRQLENVEHECEEYAVDRPPNGDDVTIARRKVFEALAYLKRAKERES